MSAVGVPEHELAALRPGDVARYLHGRGWRESGRVRYSHRWEREWGGQRRRVLLPMDPGLADYTDRMADLLDGLAAAEGRTPAAVHQDLIRTGFDVQYIRMFPRTPSGTIPVRAGVLAAMGAQDLLMAAACSAVSGEPRLVQPRRKPERARQIVDSARFGPSTPGSYILNLQLPLPDAESPQGHLFDEDPAWRLDPEPLARTVTRRMHAAVAATLTAAEHTAGTDDVSPFAAGAEQGVSADLCEALAAIGGNDGRGSGPSHGFALSFVWSPRWPAPAVAPPAAFSPRLVGVVREAAQDLRRQEPELAVTIVGRTTKLKRAGDFGPGEVTIEARLLKENGDLSGQERQIHLRLRQEDYDRATDAHRERLDLKISGDLARRGTYLELTNVTAFDVL
ncbi:hypothetical protein [Streptomyces sp. NRRL F-5126]|uniref:hypothetical protein n=1 Tax=Streptomyces sp. NRRL F-5126 TaxID=1463857 RepID=UPI0004C7DDBF|nr:hypothetical protein [Streptomyces sp. NRRL F-5126]